METKPCFPPIAPLAIQDAGDSHSQFLTISSSLHAPRLWRRRSPGLSAGPGRRRGEHRALCVLGYFKLQNRGPLSGRENRRAHPAWEHVTCTGMPSLGRFPSVQLSRGGFQGALILSLLCGPPPSTLSLSSPQQPTRPPPAPYRFPSTTSPGCHDPKAGGSESSGAQGPVALGLNGPHAWLVMVREGVPARGTQTRLRAHRPTDTTTRLFPAGITASIPAASELSLHVSGKTQPSFTKQVLSFRFRFLMTVTHQASPRDSAHRWHLSAPGGSSRGRAQPMCMGRAGNHGATCCPPRHLGTRSPQVCPTSNHARTGCLGQFTNQMGFTKTH